MNQHHEKIGYILPRYQRVLRRLKKKLDSLLQSYHRKQLKNDDFSIISNNCWGGVVSEFFGLRKNSPIVGCYFFADDYLKFISDLHHYLSLEIEMIPALQARHANSCLKET